MRFALLHHRKQRLKHQKRLRVRETGLLNASQQRPVDLRGCGHRIAHVANEIKPAAMASACGIKSGMCEFRRRRPLAHAETEIAIPGFGLVST